MHPSSPESPHPINNGTSANVDDEILSIVHHQPQPHEVTSLGEAYAIFESSEPSVTQDTPQWLDSLLTPWGLGSLLIILLANSLLSWVKLTEPHTSRTVESIPSPATLNETAKLDIPGNLNLTSDKPTALSLDSLSTTTVPQANPNSNISLQSKSQKQLAKPNISTIPTTDLKSALLPPSIQPQFVPVKTIPQPASPTLSVKTPASVQLPAEPAASPPTVDRSTMRTVNERILEKTRQNTPFIEKAKRQKQAIQSRQNLNQALDQMGQPSQQPVIPNTLVIDGQNPGNNTNQ
jgi:hypothetical protein